MKQHCGFLMWAWILATCTACAPPAPKEPWIAPAASGSSATPPPELAAPDESQPEYWIEQLEDPAQRDKAINLLSMFYEDTLTLTNHDPNAPKLRALVDVIVEPLTELYVKHHADLEPKARESLINLLSTLRDERTTPALAFALDSFAESGEGGRELKWAVRAVRDLKLVELAPSMLRVFEATRPSTKEGAYYRDVNAALEALAVPEWTPKLIPMVEAPWAPPGPHPTPEAVAAFQDGMYRAYTAAHLLGQLRAFEAVRPLLRLILDPARAEAASEALRALTQIGAPAADAAIALLDGSDAELLAYQRERLQAGKGVAPTPDPHVAIGAAIVGAIGTERGVDPVLAALASAKTPETRVPLLLALAMLPHSERTETAFAQGFRQLPVNTEYRGEIALIQLTDAAARFFEPTFSELVVERARLLREPGLKLLLALAAIKTASASSLKSVEGLIASTPQPKAGPLTWQLDGLGMKSRRIREMLELCAADTSCYLKQAGLPENQGDRLVAVVALRRVGQLAGPDVADELIAALPALEEGELRFVAAQILEHGFPKGSVALAEQLRAIVELREQSMDRDLSANDAALRETMHRLRARAGG